MRTIFRNMEKSELTEEVVHEKLQSVIERFPKLESRDLVVTLRMDNSPQQAGPDLFEVSVKCNRGFYGGIMLAKSASNLYVALAELADSMTERLSRMADRKRSQNVDDARVFQSRLADTLMRAEAGEQEVLGVG